MLKPSEKTVDAANRVFLVGDGLSLKGTTFLANLLADMTIGDIEALLSRNKLDQRVILDFESEIIDLAKALFSEFMDKLVSVSLKNAFESFDISLTGTFSFPKQYVQFFQYSHRIPLGSYLYLSLSFGAGGYYGLDFGWKAKILSMTAGATVVPYGGLTCFGEVGVGNVLYGKLRLEGEILDLRFPTMAEIGFSKFPLDVTLIMDLQLTPIKLVLYGLVTLEVDLLFETKIKVLFKKDIWRYTAPTIKKRMIDNSKDEKDESPPVFTNPTTNPSGMSRRGTPQCDVRQLPFKDYTEPAFEIAVAASDDKADVRFFLDVATFPSGSDVLHELELGGPLTVQTMILHPTGVPLFFTMYAQNSAGARSSVQCELQTYDITPPSGRMTADFRSTSNPNIVKASVLIHEDSPITDVYVGVGFGKNSYGDQMSAWTKTALTKRKSSIDIGHDPLNLRTLEHFTEAKEGKLTASKPFKVEHSLVSVGDCARRCIEFDHCVSFNYDFGSRGSCELMKTIQEFDEHLAIEGLFSHYERHGVGHSLDFSYDNFNMNHNFLHFVNLDLTNSLGYRNIINTPGVLTDFTCPESGPVNATTDILETIDCKEIIPYDRTDLLRFCIGMHPDIPNHRLIADGIGSKTVFNGHESMTDRRYTRHNTYLAANWDGFRDNETGIRAYSLSFGRSVCEDLIHPHHDPHKHLAHESFWTYLGVITEAPGIIFPLESGDYYTTVRAINKVEFGGPLSTTVCHTTPLTIDISKPFVYEVFDIKYQEDTFNISLQFNSTDPESGLTRNELCIGRRSIDCSILDWTHLDLSSYLSLTYRIPDGLAAWLCIRVTNNVDLHNIGRASQAIIVDITPPLEGTIFDGPLIKEDLRFTKDKNQICFNWADFYDPDSGISSYVIGVGTKPNLTDIMAPLEVEHYTYSYCANLAANATLEHNHTYYVYVLANNGGINIRNISTASNGVRVDLSPPFPGSAVDWDLDKFEDLNYSASKSTVKLQWKDFYDPESGIREYSVQVLRKSEHNQWGVLKNWSRFDWNASSAEWKNFHLNHRDEIKSIVRATNEALNDITAETNGFFVDLTPPEVKNLGDGTVLGGDIQYQNDQTTLNVNFYFIDPESGIDHYKFQIFESMHGTKHQLIPESKGAWYDLNDTSLHVFSIDGLSLTEDNTYIFRIAAVNRAGLLSIHDTNGVLIDTTPPDLFWVHAGVLAGDEETVVDGYVWWSDHTGIPTSWLALDHESGLYAVEYAIGTSEGGTDVKNWTLLQTVERDAFFECSLTDTDLETKTPVYYVSVKVRNGANLWSEARSSNPIIIVEDDNAGIAFDGPLNRIEHDVDYQSDIHTASVRFSGFESSQHGIMAFDWAIGTTPEGEDVKPYLQHGLVYEETGVVKGGGVAEAGYGQAAVELDPGVMYYTTVRAVTNAGNILQTTTDGFMVDITPPIINVDSISTEENITSLKTLYQAHDSYFAASWSYNETEVIDESLPDNIVSNWYTVGTYPHGFNIKTTSYKDVSNDYKMAMAVGDVILARGGVPNILSVYAKNKAGLIGNTVAPALVEDSTAPSVGLVTCSRFIQSRHEIFCEWTGFSDTESEIKHYFIQLGSRVGFTNKLTAITLPGYISHYTITGLIKNHSETLFATVTAMNSVGLNTSAYSGPITVDDTPPTSGVVVELSSTSRIDPQNDTATVEMNRRACQTLQECQSIDATCQETLTYISVAWTKFADIESAISKIEVAVGTTPGGSQIVPFFEIDVSLNNYIISNIDLNGERQVFVTVKAVNGAGLGTSVCSNGVYMSYLSQGLPPLAHVGVWDAHQTAFGDIQHQTDDTSIEAGWDMSGDPCPVIKYEWSIERTDGTIIQDWLDMGVSTLGSNDQLNLEEGARYYSLVRVTNAYGYRYTLRSDGVTIRSFPLLPGYVYDGDVFGYDLSVLPSNAMVTANWDGFGELRKDVELEDILKGNKGIDEGKEDKDESQEISYYEVALGTDRRHPKKRDNIVPFTNVMLNTSVTFRDLDLVPGFAVYYFTVRAHSASYSTATVTSNGFYVSSEGGVAAGNILMPDFIAADKYVEVQWSDYTSKVDIMLYYGAISNNTLAANKSCKGFVDGGRTDDETKSYLFNIFPVTNFGVDTFRKIENLSLSQNATYYMWIMGVDKAGKCNMTYHQFTVDITPPAQGSITGGPFYDMDVAYTVKKTEVTIKWRYFEDLESGIQHLNITLNYDGECSQESNEGFPVTYVTLGPDQSQYSFTNLTLLESSRYYVTIVATNTAGLESRARTSPIVYDNSKPQAGHVTEGAVFTADVVWWGSISSLTGSLLHQPNPSENKCPRRNMSMLDEHWAPIELNSLADPSGLHWKLVHRGANIIKNNLTKEITVKVNRDSKSDIVYSAAYSRLADIHRGGLYELKIQAADGGGKAVTGVTFWDGPDTDLHIFNSQYIDKEEWTRNSCKCCFEDPIAPNCTCNCTGMNDIDDSIYNDTSLPLNQPVETQSIITQSSCGLQIVAGENPYLTTWCRYFNRTSNPRFITRQLSYNPANASHTYNMDFAVVKEDLLETWCLRVYADDEQVSDLCGIPQLSQSTKIILHAWNKDNYMPPLEIFSLWEGRATFGELVFPPSPSALCRYGDPFVGGTNAIVSYEAGVGTDKSTTDVVPYQEIIRPCIPCTDACSLINCDPICNTTGQELLTFTLHDINLNGTFNGSLYLHVKAILGSGEEVMASSDGFAVDITPPVFDTDVMIYIDVRQGEFTPTDFQGSNNTIKSIWLCNDDKSEIQEYTWAIGSSPGGTDIQNYTSTGIHSTGINPGVEGLLEHNTTYYVSVTCTNEANLTTTYEDKNGVTVLLVEPDPDVVNASAIGVEEFDEPVYPETAKKSTDPKSCGEAWSVSPDPNVRRYDFCVGSSMESIQDIVPCIWVGYNTSGVAEIKNGHIYINDRKFYALSKLRALSKGIYDPTENESESSNAFDMEVGRTLFLHMRLCNKAELCTNKFVNTIIITNNKTEIKTSRGGEAIKTKLTSRGLRVKRDVDVLDIQIQTPDGLAPGQSVLFNILDEDQMKTEYKSDASTEFVPYITDPYVTKDMTERILHGRIQQVELSFTVSAVGQEPLPGPMTFTFKQPVQNPKPTDTISMLIHWNSVENQWQVSSNTCTNITDAITYNLTDMTNTVKVCDTRRILRENQSDDDLIFFSKETQFGLSSVLAGIVNEPPVFIGDTDLFVIEDSGESAILLEADDPEDDKVKFLLSVEKLQTAVGDIRVDENGLLYIKTCHHCSGIVNFEVIMKDNPSSPEIPSSMSVITLTLSVLQVNDPPVINLLDKGGMSLLTEDKSEPYVIYLEESTQETHLNIGTIAVFDVDINENLTLEHDPDSSRNFHLNEVLTDAKTLLNCSNALCGGEPVPQDLQLMSWLVQSLSYTAPANYTGADTFKVVATDNNGTHSDLVVVRVFLMLNSCKNGGRCKSKVPNRYTCNDVRRTTDFDTNFRCDCPPSWQGLHCDVDVNECFGNPCPASKLCKNTEGGFECHCPTGDLLCQASLEGWQVALIAICCIIVAVAIGVVVTWKVKLYRTKKRLEFYGIQTDKNTLPLSAQMKRILNQPRVVNPSSTEDEFWPDNTGEEAPPMHLFTKRFFGLEDDVGNEEEEANVPSPIQHLTQQHFKNVIEDDENDEKSKSPSPPMRLFTKRLFNKVHNKTTDTRPLSADSKVWPLNTDEEERHDPPPIHLFTKRLNVETDEDTGKPLPLHVRQDGVHPHPDLSPAIDTKPTKETDV